MFPFAVIKNQVTVVTCSQIQGTTDVAVWAVRNSAGEQSSFPKAPLDGSVMTLEYRKIRSNTILQNLSFPIVDNCGTQIKVTSKAIIIGCPSYQGIRGRITIYEIPS